MHASSSLQLLVRSLGKWVWNPYMCLKWWNLSSSLFEVSLSSSRPDLHVKQVCGFATLKWSKGSECNIHFAPKRWNDEGELLSEWIGAFTFQGLGYIPQLLPVCCRIRWMSWAKINSLSENAFSLRTHCNPVEKFASWTKVVVGLGGKWDFEQWHYLLHRNMQTEHTICKCR